MEDIKKLLLRVATDKAAPANIAEEINKLHHEKVLFWKFYLCTIIRGYEEGGRGSRFLDDFSWVGVGTLPLNK